MDYLTAFKILQEHFDNIEATPEEHVKFGNALITIHDYVEMLQEAFHETSGMLKKHLVNEANQ